MSRFNTAEKLREYPDLDAASVQSGRHCGMVLYMLGFGGYVGKDCRQEFQVRGDSMDIFCFLTLSAIWIVRDMTATVLTAEDSPSIV